MKIDTRYVEIGTLILETILLLGFVFLVFNKFGYSLEYYTMGGLIIWIVLWRFWCYGYMFAKEQSNEGGEE